MRITNIDANVEYTRKMVEIIPFVLDVAEKNRTNLIKDYLCLNQHRVECKCPLELVKVQENPIRMFENFGYLNVLDLLHTIPIYLHQTNKLVSYCDSGYQNNEGEDCILHTIDLLGMYFPNNDNPYIELYMEQIENATNPHKKNGEERMEHFKWLFAMTLYHELAHAAMDIHNCEGFAKCKEKVSYSTPFGKIREESMANAVALRIIKNYRNRNITEYVKEYMKSQPKEYALGVKMVNFDYWDFRSVVDCKRFGINSELQDKWSGIMNDFSMKKLQKFNKDYYHSFDTNKH